MKRDILKGMLGNRIKEEIPPSRAEAEFGLFFSCSNVQKAIESEALFWFVY